jgi:hypothetical protein
LAWKSRQGTVRTAWRQAQALRCHRRKACTPRCPCRS